MSVYLSDFVKAWDALHTSYPAQRATLLNHFYSTVVQRSPNSDPRSPTATVDEGLELATCASGVVEASGSPTSSNAHVAITVNGHAVRWRLHPVKNQSAFFLFTPPAVEPTAVETSMLLIRFSAYLKILVTLHFKNELELILLHLQCILFLLNCQGGTEHAKVIYDDYVQSSSGPGLLMELLSSARDASVSYNESGSNSSEEKKGGGDGDDDEEEEEEEEEEEDEETREQRRHTLRKIVKVLFDMINVLALSSRQNKEALCRLEVIHNIVATISVYVEEPAEEDQDFAKKSKNHLMTAAIESSAKEVLMELCSGNPRHFESVKNGILTLLGSTVMSKRIGVQVLLAIVTSGVVTEGTSMFVLPTLALTRNLDVMLQYEAIELLTHLTIDNCLSVCISISAALNSNSGSGTGPAGVLMALKRIANVRDEKVNIEVGMVKTGIIEELLNVIVNQVHTDEVYFHAADCLRQGSTLGEGTFKRRLTVYVKKQAHLDNLFNESEANGPRIFFTRLLADSAAVRYIRDKLHDKACELFEKKRSKRLEAGDGRGTFFVTEGEERGEEMGGLGVGGVEDDDFENLLNNLDNFDLTDVRVGGVGTVEPPKPNPPPRKSPRSGKRTQSPRVRKAPDPKSLTQSPYKTLMEKLINNSVPEMSQSNFKAAMLRDEFERVHMEQMQQQHLVFVETAPPVLGGGVRRTASRGKKGAEGENGGTNVENGLMIGGNKLKGTLEFVDSFPLI
ncbi:hypothetical protein TrVE_jg9925 [Triparma verrucosa]|uniref:Uncharacterized protein n=1 Tax=Triparma verrucosa TaxID=1606542 RepID=A0A9W7F613_9STRA|nr:hypothetical protein TrVE_jg9925 [Triparma verrucosa]